MKKGEKHLISDKTTGYVISTEIWTPQADKWSGEISYDTFIRGVVKSFSRKLSFELRLEVEKVEIEPSSRFAGKTKEKSKKIKVSEG
jgi:hypothetical protein